MPEFDATNNMVWPIPFVQPTMNRASGGTASDASQIPWLIGVDGRSRGTLEPFPGMTELGWAPAYYTATITVANYAWVGTTTITIGSVVVNINLVPSGSNAAAAAAIESAIDALTATYPFISASSASDVVTLRWATGYGYGTPTYGATGGSIQAPTAAGTEMSEVYTADAGTTLDALFVKYLTIRLGSGKLLRGYLIQKTNGNVIYLYKLGTGGIPFTDYITVHTGVSAYKMGAAGGGRVAYVVGSSTTVGGTGFSKVIVSTSTGAGPLLKVYDMATDGAVSAIGAPYINAGTNPNGQLTAGYYMFAYRYYDSIRRRYSPLSAEAVSAGAYADLDKVTVGNYNNPTGSNTADTFLPLTNTKGAWDYVQFYSTLSNGATGTKKVNLPFYSRGLKALSNDYWEWKTAYLYGVAGGDDFLSDASLVYSGDPWSVTTDYVNTTLPVMEDIAFFGGSNFALEPENELLNIRWTPLHRIEPENFPPLNSRRTNIPSNGSAHFCQAGDFLWVLGDGESHRIQKVGTQMSVFRMLEGISVVGCRASVAVGGDIYAVTTQGLLQINAETGDYTQVSAVDRIILKRWAKNLRDASPISPRIFVTHDARLGTVTVFNKSVGEAIVLWLTTGRVSFMVDMWYEYMVTGRVPNDATGGNVSVLMTELADGRSYGGLFLTYADYRSSSPNMMGITAVNSASLLWSMMRTSSISTLAGSDTVLRFPSGNGGGGVLDYDDLDKYIGRAPLTGCVVYAMSGTTVRGFKVIDSERYNIAPGNCYVELTLDGDVRSYFTPDTTIVSIAPVVMAAMGPPLSGLYAADMLSRRHTSYYNLILSWGSSDFETSTDPLVEYYASRMNDSGDETVLDAPAGSIMAEPARDLPFTSSVPVVKSGTNTSFEASTPKHVWSEVLADGGILYPGFRWCRSGQWAATPGLYVFGRVNPNQRVEAV